MNLIHGLQKVAISAVKGTERQSNKAAEVARSAKGPLQDAIATLSDGTTNKAPQEIMKGVSSAMKVFNRAIGHPTERQPQPAFVEDQPTKTTP